MEKVKVDVLAHVPANIADELARLRIITDVPAFASRSLPHHLRFRCITCERGVDSHKFDRVVLERLGGSYFGLTTLHCVPSGLYPLIEFGNSSLAAILPFDFRKWQGHLLHDVRAEWDRQFICARGVNVQAWNGIVSKGAIEIVGEQPAPAKHLRDIDVSTLRRNALIRVIATEQYFCWLPESSLTDDGVLVIRASPDVGRFVLDAQPRLPADADLEAEAL